jgi:hypothetical protein
MDGIIVGEGRSITSSEAYMGGGWVLQRRTLVAYEEEIEVISLLRVFES